MSIFNSKKSVLWRGLYCLLPKDLQQSISRYYFVDITDSRSHSGDFSATRAEYIQLRVRWLTMFFAVVIPLWIPIDYFTLSAEHFERIVAARIALSLMLYLLYQLSLVPLSLMKTQLLLVLVMAAPLFFYMASMLVMASGEAELPPAGYAFQPFIMVCLLALFPLTLIESLSLVGLVFAVYVVTQQLTGVLLTMDTLNGIWVFGMFAGAVLWIQFSQLHMLLHLYRESSSDYLTGLINRRLLMKRMDMELERAKRGAYTFSVLMFDLDRFKRINDQYGHASGDRVLIAMAELLKAHVAELGMAARFGGEEFALVLSGIDGQQAALIAERIRSACEAAPVLLDSGEQLKITTSVGVTEYEAGDCVSAVLNRADEALYMAKDKKRNCVVSYQNAGPVEASGCVA